MVEFPSVRDFNPLSTGSTVNVFEELNPTHNGAADSSINGSAFANGIATGGRARCTTGTERGHEYYSPHAFVSR